MKIQNISKDEQRLHVRGVGYTLAPASVLELEPHEAKDLADSFPDRFALQTAKPTKANKKDGDK